LHIFACSPRKIILHLLGGIAESDNAAYCDSCYRSRAWSVCIRVSVTLVHSAKVLDGMRCHFLQKLASSNNVVWSCMDCMTRVRVNGYIKYCLATWTVGTVSSLCLHSVCVCVFMCVIFIMFIATISIGEINMYFVAVTLVWSQATLH